MKLVAGLLAALKAASWLQSITGWLALIPGIGPIASIASAAFGFIAKAVKAFFEGLSIAFANPVVFLVIGVAFGVGVWQGIAWDAHKVEVARAETDNLRKANKAADDDSKRRLAAAEQARVAAEEAAKAADDRESRARGELKRMRSVAGKGAATDGSKGSWLSGFSPVSKADGAPKPGR